MLNRLRNTAEKVEPVLESNTAIDSYLSLLEKCIINTIYEDECIKPWSKDSRFNPDKRELGRDWPAKAHSMIGAVRMRNLRWACEKVIKENIPGDFIETGVWRGGACIMMKGVLNAYDDYQRKVWVADSFEGLPKPDEDNYSADEGDPHHTYKELIVSVEDVKRNFKKYSLLDSRVKFLQGWFKDTLPNAAIDKLAVLRLDGDMYESTVNAFEALYHKLQPGGVLIVDDYGAIDSCKEAVHDFRRQNGITESINDIDSIGVYWVKN